MTLKFSENLTKYRKRSGLTQKQLAMKINVTPQAVSKWEKGSLPDSELIPILAQTLGVSTDVLFGIAEERDEPDLEQLLMDKIRQTPEKERADLIMKLFYSMMSAYNQYRLSKVTYPKELELETYAEIITDHEIAIARLNDDLKYFCFMKVPENGINSYVDASERMVDLFQTLADEDAIKIVCYLGSGVRNRMQSIETISKRMGIPLKKVEYIIDRLDRFGIVWRVSVEVDDKQSIVYGYVNSMPVTLLLTVAKSLTRYIQFHDLYVDTWKHGPFRMPDVANDMPVPQVSLWSEEKNQYKEKE
ncbi:MAG: helix-turn-helix transcriptional regulator [Prevotella sp.]|nr:helix-turn-helix transcriptional regulator [Alistipes senegalensis]MCM1357231.1 helix-turn-helix transcriptional regulator [Prevotella sp.]MCM1472853.1 helix-turn-helix transcriptional regulator [Muribaculaceae bacterium]